MPLVFFIPNSYKDGFTELEKLQDESFAAIQEALKTVSMCSSTEELAANVANYKDLDAPLIDKIFSSVGALIPLLEAEDQIEEAASDVTELLKSANADTFKSRLIELLKDKKIYFASKASDLITETENVFLNCKIVTDIRPIFGLNVEEQPNVGLIMHNLHIHYQGTLSGQHQDIYLSLNSSDIQSLIEALIRAEKKDENLQSLLKKWGISNLNE